MDNYTYDVIYLDDSRRIRIVHDDFGMPAPVDDGAPFTALIYRPYSSNFEVTEFNEKYWNGSADGAEVRQVYWGLGKDWELVKRFFRMFHDTVIHVSHHHGYSQGDDWTLVSFDTPKWRAAAGVDDSVSIADAEWLEPVYWARSDVYGAILEEWEDECGNPDHDDWTEKDSLWGFYGEYDEPEFVEHVKSSF